MFQRLLQEEVRTVTKVGTRASQLHTRHTLVQTNAQETMLKRIGLTFLIDSYALICDSDSFLSWCLRSAIEVEVDISGPTIHRNQQEKNSYCVSHSITLLIVPDTHVRLLFVSHSSVIEVKVGFFLNKRRLLSCVLLPVSSCNCGEAARM